MIGRVVDVVQRSDAWYQLRVGRLTGSRVVDMLATRKDRKEAAARADLRLQLACERLTGQSAETRFVTRDMQRGIDQEPAAVAAYEAATGTIVHPIGFVEHPDLMAGCSPDGGVEDGVIEIKCPAAVQHFTYLRARTVPAEYFGQILHTLWLTGAAWCDFVSFDDRFPRPLQLFTERVHASVVDLAAYELTVRAFLREVDDETAALARLAGVAA